MDDLIKIRLGVGEFALPVPRTGSIESQSGYGYVMEGPEIHSRIQAERKETDSSYRSEVKIAAEFPREEFLFQISGKIDGLYPEKPPRIEEIKSSFNVSELEKKLRKNPDHPYCLQLKTYGYFYFLHHEVIPKLSFVLVSARNFATEELEIEFDTDIYEVWLEDRLQELVTEARASQTRAARRKSYAAQFSFPFERKREGQEALMHTVREGILNNKRMMLQAPTGLGKTVGVLHPALKEAMTRGQRVLYITPKNSQHSVAEDAVEKFKEGGCRVKSLTLTAKSKICFKNEPLCNPDYCEYAKDHYTKAYQHGLRELLSKKRKLTSRVIRTIAKEHEVCPYELQLDAVHEADVVIGDYNYVFSPRSAFTQISATALGHEGKATLVIDEAHNLHARALGYYSPELSTATLIRMKDQVDSLPENFQSQVRNLIESCIATVKAAAPEDAKTTTEIEPPGPLFLEQEAELRTFLSRYLESDHEIQPRDVVLRLCFYWSEFTEALGFVMDEKRPEFFTVFRPDRHGGGAIRIVCCDASEMLKACYDNYDQVIGFSATLKPFDYYAKLSGLEPTEILTAEFQSPFPKNHRKLLIIPEISTKFSERERNYGKIAEAVHRIAAVKRGNYFVFFPSFEFLDRVAQQFNVPDGFMMLRQTPQMTATDAASVFDHLKSLVHPTLVFAVQGGIFSEGVDYPGDIVIGAFIVGPPLPPFDFEREKIRKYYEEKYASGFDYAYTFPAMAKAVQAAGRVIRSETDRGLIVLMDSRFLHRSYSQSMPSDWFVRSPQELVSRRILEDVAKFWEE